MPTMNRASRTSASASWPSWTFGIAPAEPRLDHHLLAVVGPALDVRRRGEQGRAPHLRLHLPEVLEVEEVAGEHLVHRDAPQRRVVQVAQVLALAFLGPAAQRVGEVVGRAGRLGLERAGHPQAGRRPAQEPRTGRHLHVLAVGHVEDAAAGQERPQFGDLLAGGGNQRPGRGVRVLGAAPRLDGVAAVEPPGQRAEGLLRARQLTLGDLQQPFAGVGQPLVELQLAFEPFACRA